MWLQSGHECACWSALGRFDEETDSQERVNSVQMVFVRSNASGLQVTSRGMHPTLWMLSA